MRLRTSLIAAIFMATAAAPSWSGTFYVAPRTAPASTVTPDGSQNKPWKTVNQALNNAKAGDTILLMDGEHWGLKVSKSFDTPVTIRSQNGKKGRLSWIAVGSPSRNLVFKDISVWPSDPAKPATRNLIETGSGASEIVFDGIDGRSGEDAANYPTWGKAKWFERKFKGFVVRGPNTTIKNSTLVGVSFGIVASGTETRILNSTISGFSYDGMRILGNNIVVRGNKITDCVRIDGNHADAIQSWSVNGKPVDGVVLDGNTILEWSAAKSNPLRCGLQGIGFFDGFFDNLQITNNIIGTSTYHGISVYGGRNVAVVNNTVVNIKGSGTTYPWVKIASHKNGTPPRDVLVANNLAHKFSFESKIVNRTGGKNMVVLYPAKVLTDVTTFNYRPKADSGFINSADATFAPKVDLLNKARPYGGGPDIGAYEVGSTSSPTSTTSYLLSQTAGSRLASQ